MAAVLASHSCCRRHLEPSDIGRVRPGISFSGSISSIKFAKLEESRNDPWVAKGSSRVVAEVLPSEADKLGGNGRAIKMAPTKEVVKSAGVSPPKIKSVNGSGEAVNSSKILVNGSKVAVNGASLVKRDGTRAIVKTQENKAYGDFSFTEELKILPSDEGFSWAKDDYNSWQRTVDIWSFVLSLRLRVLFDNAKWAYPGGFTEEKQVKLVPG